MSGGDTGHGEKQNTAKGVMGIAGCGRGLFYARDAGKALVRRKH